MISHPDPLSPALESATEELARRASRFEVFVRQGESAQLIRTHDSSLERRQSRELGVACRVFARQRVGFAAAAGSAARAGRQAALAALDAMRPSPDPLPPAEALGTSGSALPHPTPDSEAQELFTCELTAAFAAEMSQMGLMQVRLLTGASRAALGTAEGVVEHASAGGAVVELLVAPPAGPWRHVHVAAPRLADIVPRILAARTIEACLLTSEGGTPPRQLADVLLAPAVAAPLVVALAQHLARETSGQGERVGVRVSSAWHLVDERPGPAGLLPLPWDGEGLPARRIVLADGGRLGESFATWERARRTGEKPGGAVRPTYRHPPFPGPSNLVVLPTAAVPQVELLARLERGFYLALPAGPVRVDAANARFALRAAGVAVQHGRPVAAHPLLEVSGSFRRLLAALVVTGGDVESFSLASAVTTPSMLFHRLEIA
jgi:predicted Zn-dependent protease